MRVGLHLLKAAVLLVFPWIFACTMQVECDVLRTTPGYAKPLATAAPALATTG